MLGEVRVNFPRLLNFQSLVKRKKRELHVY